MSGPTWPTKPATFLALDPKGHSLERSRVVLIPVPYDATTSYRGGTREAPSAIIAASAEMEDYDVELEREPQTVGLHTAAAIEPHAGGPEAMAARVTEAVRWHADQGKLVGMLGGEHSLSAGAVEALSRRHPGMSVLVFDAQADLRESYQGAAYSHASASRRMLDHAPVTIVGVRSMTAEERAVASEHSVALFPRGAEPIVDIDAIVESLSKDVYISVDLDALDPSFMAAVGTPEPGGMGWWESLRILRAVAERRNVVGFDVMELAPREGPEACAYTAAKLVYKLVGYCTAGASG